MPIGDFKFAADTHTYWFGDRRITGITEAMSRAGLSPKAPESGRMRRNFEYAGERGTAVHKACELYDLGHLDQYTLDDNLKGYLDAWKFFCNQFEFKPFGTELPMGHTLYYYGGTPDVWGESKLGKIVVERKSRALMEHDGFQLAGQDMLIKEHFGFQSKELVGVQLKATGTYAMRSYNQPHFKSLFLSAVAISNYQISGER